MVFSRFVEVGRVAVITYGPDAGKPVIIVDIVDQSKALVDGPISSDGVKRQVISYRRIQLTDDKVNIPRAIGSSALKNKLSSNSAFSEKWLKSAWAKKQAIRQKRTSMTDFDRFKLKMAKKSRNSIVSQELTQLSK